MGLVENLGGGLASERPGMTDTYKPAANSTLTVGIIPFVENQRGGLASWNLGIMGTYRPPPNSALIVGLNRFVENPAVRPDRGPPRAT